MADDSSRGERLKALFAVNGSHCSSSDGADAGTVSGGLDLEGVLVPTYIADIPFDPTDPDGDTNTTTDYRICVQTATGNTGRVVAIAEQEVTTDGSTAYITITR